MDITKGIKVRHVESDGTENLCKVVEVGTSPWVTVRWLEARWNIRSDSLLNRKGTTSTVSMNSLRFV